MCCILLEVELENSSIDVGIVEGFRQVEPESISGLKEARPVYVQSIPPPLCSQASRQPCLSHFVRFSQDKSAPLNSRGRWGCLNLQWSDTTMHRQLTSAGACDISKSALDERYHSYNAHWCPRCLARNRDTASRTDPCPVPLWTAPGCTRV